ncbi:DUF2063 domain-containing protein [Epilithonimonas sp.]|uniref:HvfC/BufC N-terminal domain-containing protein n=1 Tax=Epilithonimonas sp. TaxID=2894511 RepID=UPI0035AF28C2
MSLTKTDTVTLQEDLAFYCRTGLQEPITSIQENTPEYRRIVFGIVKDTLKTAFPIARKFLGKKKWKKLVYYFFANHQCKTPQVWKLPLELCEFYREHSFPFKKEFPFLAELLYFEWLEIEVFMMEDSDIPEFTLQARPEQKTIVANPEIKILGLQYPVHIKRAKDITEADIGQYFVTIHRNNIDKQVYFNDWAYPFIEMIIQINEQETTLKDLEKIYSKYESNKSTIRKTTEDFVHFAIKNNIILGYN